MKFGIKKLSIQLNEMFPLKGVFWSVTKKPTLNFLDAYDFLKVKFLTKKIKTRKVYVSFHLIRIRTPAKNGAWDC